MKIIHTEVLIAHNRPQWINISTSKVRRWGLGNENWESNYSISFFFYGRCNHSQCGWLACYSCIIQSIQFNQIRRVFLNFLFFRDLSLASLPSFHRFLNLLSPFFLQTHKLLSLHYLQFAKDTKGKKQFCKINNCLYH